jgi:aspartate-semialdehyde dehydrogenase
MAKRKWPVSIVGATGLVGSEVAKILVRRKFPVDELRLFSSGRTNERETTIMGKPYPIRPFKLEALGKPGFCFLGVAGDISRRIAGPIADLGHVVIDNSSAFRMDADVPLVVPEVNPGDLAWHRGIIANPNCSTIQMVVVLAPLHRKWKLRRVIVSTYQSVSGAGLAAVGELATQSVAVLEGRKMPPRAFRHQVAFNVVPRIDDFDGDGWTGEERKLMNETRKIIGDPAIEVMATAARVPVFRGHSESVYAEFDHDVDLAETRRILGAAAGVTVVDDPASDIYPMPVDCVGTDKTLVGRLRLATDSRKALCMWIVSDNVWKGAALNAVQIAETML